MLELVVSNGIAYVWTAQDWSTLRNDHGIIGCFDGAQTPSEVTQKLLPFKLTQVETQFLIKTGIAKTVEIPSLKHSTAPTTLHSFQDMRRKRIQDQLVEYKVKRRSDIESMVDKIIEGKRKKGRFVLPDRNAVIQDELDKIKHCPELITFDLVDPWTSTPDSHIPYEFPMPRTPLDTLRLRVFEDFRSVRKYFLTPGLKFGADFLAYPGDPTTHHAEYIIICEAEGRRMSDSSVITQLRLAECVKKIFLIANLDGDRLNYKRIRGTKCE